MHTHTHTHKLNVWNWKCIHRNSLTAKKFHKYFNKSIAWLTFVHWMCKYLNMGRCCCCPLVECECLTTLTTYVLSNVVAHSAIKLDMDIHRVFMQIFIWMFFFVKWSNWRVSNGCTLFVNFHEIIGSVYNADGRISNYFCLPERNPELNWFELQ